MYNQRVLAKLGFNAKTTTSDAYKDPRIGPSRCSSRWRRRFPSIWTSKPWSDTTLEFSPSPAPEKSNLLSNILRRLLIHQPEVKVIVFDISSEYPFLLMDLFADDKIPSR